jgi:hypothetical protein
MTDVKPFDLAQGYVDAHQLIDACEQGTPHPVGVRWLQRARHHLLVRYDRWLRGDQVPVDHDRAVIAAMKSAAAELVEAGKALDASASALRDSGAGKDASKAKQAATRAMEAAGRFRGEA